MSVKQHRRSGSDRYLSSGKLLVAAACATAMAIAGNSLYAGDGSMQQISAGSSSVMADREDPAPTSGSKKKKGRKKTSHGSFHY